MNNPGFTFDAAQNPRNESSTLKIPAVIRSLEAVAKETDDDSASKGATSHMLHIPTPASTVPET